MVAIVVVAVEGSFPDFIVPLRSEVHASSEKSDGQ